MGENQNSLQRVFARMKLKEKLSEQTNPYDEVHDYEEHGVHPSSYILGFDHATNLIYQALLEYLEKSYDVNPKARMQILKLIRDAGE